jgi:hypothetical protein
VTPARPDPFIGGKITHSAASLGNTLVAELLLDGYYTTVEIAPDGRTSGTQCVSKGA